MITTSSGYTPTPADFSIINSGIKCLIETSHDQLILSTVHQLATALTQKNQTCTITTLASSCDPTTCTPLALFQLPEKCTPVATNVAPNLLQATIATTVPLEIHPVSNHLSFKLMSAQSFETAVAFTSVLLKRKMLGQPCPPKKILASVAAKQSHDELLPSLQSGPRQRTSIKNTPTKPLRKISKAPYKVLDAPSLYDDYYLNLLDWSSQNVLAVALGNSVSLWSACTSKVSILCDLSPDAVTSVTWNLKGDQLAIGTNNGKVSIWDITENRIVREIHAHSSRVGVMSWSSQLLASGSRDRHIYCYDLRIGSTVNNNSNTSNNDSNNDFTTYSSPHRYSVFNDASYTTSLSNLNTTMFSSQMTNYNNNTTSSPTGGIISSVSSPNRNNYIVFDFNNHKQEVCGLKWSFDEKLLASGGNDNKLFIWSVNQSRNNEPLYEFSDHGAAVKAVAWSPHQHGLIASGGGTADRHIRFWNALNGVALHKVDTGSQVCNLLWSKNVNELVSTHGYSLNQVIIWKYPTMQKLATLTGHTLRVLYLAGSPDGKSIVTGAGDETLRFWNVFPGSKNRSGHQIGPSVLIPSALDIR
eukprot:gene19996-25968_t